MKVRVYGDTAVATYTETYDALTRGKRVAKTIITTDTFVKVGGQWKLAAAPAPLSYIRDVGSNSR
jgi:hypothetical protein